MYPAYPPPDVSVRDYLLDPSPATIQERYALFLWSLFTCAMERLQNVDRQGVPLAKWWYSYLHDGATPTQPGPKRTEFYEAVIERANYKVRSTLA